MASKPLNYYQIATLTSAKSLATIAGGTIPTGATWALIQAETQDVRWRDDGTDPTAAIGMLLKANDSIIIDGPSLAKIKFFQVTATAVLNVTFYK